MSRFPIIDPTRVDFQQADGINNPETPFGEPGTWWNGRRGDTVTACLPAVQQVSSVLFGVSVAATDVITLTITPLANPHGSAAAEGMAPATVSFTATTTNLSDIPTGLIAAAAAAATVSSPSGLNTWRRMLSYVTLAVGSPAEQLLITSKQAGFSFSVTVTASGLTTATVATVTSSATRTAKWGTYMAIDRTKGGNGYNDRGQPYLKPIESTTPVADIVGPVVEGSNSLPISSGDLLRQYGDGNVPIAIYGEPLAASAGAIPASSIGTPVYIRHTANGAALPVGIVTNAAGAASGATANVWTGTPVAANDTLYSVRVTFGLATATLVYLSDGTATATEINNGLAADLLNYNGSGGPLQGITAVGGATLVLTGPADGRGFTPAQSGPGVIAFVETTPEVSTHIMFPRDKIAAACPSAGSVPVTIPH